VQSTNVYWEQEPNNTAAEADGPILSGPTYYGALPDEDDERDYFYFDLPSTHTISLWLTHIPAGHDYDLYLYNAAGDQVGKSNRYGNDDEYIVTAPQPPGYYYILVYHYSPGGSPQAYNLTAVYR
jgi:serine protease